VGDSNGAGLSFREVAGLITFTPTGGSNNGVTLRVPYYLVPRALSGVNATMPMAVPTSSPSTNATLRNPSGPIAGNADFYAWGLNDSNDAGTSSADVRAIGVQSFASPTGTDPNRRLIVFAVNAWDRFSNASTNEFDIYVDVDPANANGDDYIVVGVDQGAVQAGVFNGRMAAFVFSTRSPGASVLFFAAAPTDSSTALLPVRSDQFCRAGEPCMSTSPDKRFNYHAFGFDLKSDFVDAVAGTAKFNAGPTSAISQGMFEVVPRGASRSVPVSISPLEWELTPALGAMVVTLDNKAGKDEAALLPLRLTP
jgi:minor extracellular serine protease Vpr